VADVNTCFRCGRKTVAKKITLWRGQIYGKTCWEYCFSRSIERSCGKVVKKECRLCGTPFPCNVELCDSGLCCWCCLKGSRYCDR